MVGKLRQSDMVPPTRSVDTVFILFFLIFGRDDILNGCLSVTFLQLQTFLFFDAIKRSIEICPRLCGGGVIYVSKNANHMSI